MRIIGTLADLAMIRESGLYRPELVNLLEEDLKQLIKSLEELGGEHDPRVHGYQVLLERGDNVRDLGALGISEEGLMATAPEYCRATDIGGETVYCVGVLYDNECMYAFYCLPHWMGDPELARWLEEQAENGCDGGYSEYHCHSGLSEEKKGCLPEDGGQPF